MSWESYRQHKNEKKAESFINTVSTRAASSDCFCQRRALFGACGSVSSKRGLVSGANVQDVFFPPLYLFPLFLYCEMFVFREREKKMLGIFFFFNLSFLLLL